MSTPPKPTLVDAAKRNPAIVPHRVRQMQETVKKLQDRGMLQPPKYGLQPGLAGSASGISVARGTVTMNSAPLAG
jgi:hypothetical protein